MLFADYLKQKGIPCYYGGGIHWWIYEKIALIPASPIPTFIDMSRDSCELLLEQSGTQLIRWSSEPSSQETPWWWVVCDEYDLSKVSSNTRNKIKRGLKRSQVRQVSSEWLAKSGYECYKKAFQRYKNAQPMSEESFSSAIIQRSDFPSLFENWGIFVEDQLAGYIVCVVEGKNGVTTGIIKYDPDYLKDYTSYAMMDAILNHYINERGLPVSNGTRAVSHDTNIQDFMLKFGFRRQYCRLNIYYKSLFGLVISALYPFRTFIPDLGPMHKAKSLLFQEKLRRNCK